jgi:hypothetical protein
MDRTRPRALVGASLVLVVMVLAGCGGGAAGPAWWGLQAEVGPDSTEVPILVRVGSSSCNRYEGVTTVETDESVTITADVSHLASRNCTSDLQAENVLVQLERPLGDRELKGCAHTDRRRCDEVSALVG